MNFGWCVIYKLFSLFCQFPDISFEVVLESVEDLLKLISTFVVVVQEAMRLPECEPPHQPVQHPHEDDQGGSPLKVGSAPIPPFGTLFLLFVANDHEINSDDVRARRVLETFF